MSVAGAIGVTMSSLHEVTYGVWPSGAIAIASGRSPTGIALPGVFVAVVIGVTHPARVPTMRAGEDASRYSGVRSDSPERSERAPQPGPTEPFPAQCAESNLAVASSFRPFFDETAG